MSGTYTIVYTEKLVGLFCVDADSEDQAIEEFQNQMAEGRIDFSKMDVVDSNVTVEVS